MAEMANESQDRKEGVLGEACHRLNNVLGVLSGALELHAAGAGDTEFLVNAMSRARDSVEEVVRKLRAAQETAES